MIVSSVVTVFHSQSECYIWGLQSVYRRGYFSQYSSGHCSLDAKEAQSLLSQLYIDKGATQKTQYLEFISYPDQALQLLMTRSFPSLSCSSAGLIPVTQNAFHLPPSLPKIPPIFHDPPSSCPISKKQLRLTQLGTQR